MSKGLAPPINEWHLLSNEDRYDSLLLSDVCKDDGCTRYTYPAHVGWVLSSQICRRYTTALLSLVALGKYKIEGCFE